jgi:anti-anti-sigma factor
MKGTYDDALPDPELSSTPGEGNCPAGDGADTAPGLSALATFDSREADGCTVVDATGEIDVSTAPAFRAALVNAVERSERLVVDLSRVTFLDCAGLSALATVTRRVRATGETPHLVGVTGIVGRVVALTRLDEVVVVDGSVDDALASMTKAAS